MDHGIGVFRHVVWPSRLPLEFPRETGLILRCAGKVGNPFETKQWNRPSYCDQERRKASDEVVPETSVSPLVRSVYRGTFGVASRVPSTVLHQFIVTPWTVAHQAPQSVGFSRQEYRRGLLFSSPGSFPNQGSNLHKTVLGTLDATPKVPLYTDLTRGDTEVSGTTSSEAFLLS